MKIKKVVIPAAGLGTRFLPATKSLAKEMLPIVDKPCIQYLVEEAVASGIKEIIIVTSNGKESIKNHFSPSTKLKEHLRKNKKVAYIKELEKIEKMAKIHYVKQPFPGGDGHAILCAKKYIKNEPFAVLFGDDIYDSKVPALKQLIKEYEKYQSPIVGIEEIDKKDSEKYGIVDSKTKNSSSFEIINMVEKPKPQKAPSNLGIIGKYIVTPELFKTLSKSKPASKSKELRLIDGMKGYLKSGKIRGLKIKGQRFDTGDKLGYLKAVIHFALKNKELSAKLKQYIKKFPDSRLKPTTFDE